MITAKEALKFATRKRSEIDHVRVGRLLRWIDGLISEQARLGAVELDFRIEPKYGEHVEPDVDAEEVAKSLRASGFEVRTGRGSIFVSWSDQRCTCRRATIVNKGVEPVVVGHSSGCPRHPETYAVKPGETK